MASVPSLVEHYGASSGYQRAREPIDVRNSRVGLAVAVLVVALAGPSSAVAAPTSIGGSMSSTRLAHAVRNQQQPPVLPPPVAPPVSPVLRDMLDGVNAERSSHGLAPLRYDERLVLAAQWHSDDQARQGRLSHTGTDGSTLEVRVDRFGYDWLSVAENVAYGSPDAASVLVEWMASASHRRNILSANVDLGVGLAYGADGRAYWTQVFAAPR